MMNFRKIFPKALMTALILSFLMTQVSFTAECDDMPNHVLRLHIVANSDSKDDQLLKLKVRDCILKQSATLFRSADNKTEAQQIAGTNLDKIIAYAQETVNNSGYDYKVTGTLAKDMYFNTRVYDNFTLPSGNYDALHIVIGKGKGHNWWCVCFPPMCFSMAEDSESRNLSDVLSEEELRIAENSEHYEYRLKIVEIYHEIKNMFN